MHGIVNNNDFYSKQCIILILPNLLNLDPSVINEDCLEFLELVKALESLVSKISNSQEEIDV